MTSTTNNKVNTKSTTSKIFAIGALGLMAGSLATAAFAADDSSFNGEEMQNNVQMHKPPMFMQDQAILDAIDMADYDAFLEALEGLDAKALEHMNEDKFEEIVERHATHEEIKAAVEAGDYEAWLNAVSDFPNADVLTQAIDESEFATLLEIMELRESGDHEAAKELAQEIGLPEMKQEIKEGVKESWQERKGERQETRGQVRDSIQSNDYEGFQEGMQNLPRGDMFQDFSEEDFEKLTQMHELRKSGDQEGAELIREELGLPEPPQNMQERMQNGMNGKTQMLDEEGKPQMQNENANFQERPEGMQGRQGFRGFFHRFFN